MKDIQQLIKKNNTLGRYEDIYPMTYTNAVYDKESNENLDEILSGFNMYFLSYVGSREQTRLLVVPKLRKLGLWITYVLYNKTIVIEYYSNDDVSDNAWLDSKNWRIGTNTLVGDITISSKGNWVINGTDTGQKALGELGITPLLRVGTNNRLLVSYTKRLTWVDISDIPIITLFRVYNNKLQLSIDLGSTWTDSSDYIAAWFKFTGVPSSSLDNNVGKILISRDNGSSWTDLSGVFTNSLYIKGYVATVGALPSSAVQGDIYGVGPTYDPSDTGQTNPIYQLYVKGSTGWVNNGKFTSIAAGVVQTTGTSITEVMSQNAVTTELDSLRSDLSEMELNITDELYGRKTIEQSDNLQSYYISDNGEWAVGSNINSSLISVVPEEQYHIKAKTSNFCTFAVLESDNHAYETQVQYATGCSLVRLQPDEDAIVAIPSDGHYLYVTYSANGNDRRPEYIKLLSSESRISTLEGEIPAIQDSIEVLEEQVFETIELEGTEEFFYSIQNDTWNVSPSVSCYIIPIIPECPIKIKGSTEHNTYAAILKSNTHSAGTSVDYATGCSLLTISGGEYVTIDIPSDGNYIYLSHQANGDSRDPEYAKQYTGKSNIKMLKDEVLLLKEIRGNVVGNTKNLFNKYTIQPGALSSNGTISSDITIWHSDLIEVGGNPFVLSFNVRPSDTYIRVGWYDSNKDFVVRDSPYYIVSTERSLVVENPSSYPYVVISIKYGVEDELQLEIGTVKTDYVPYYTGVDSIARGNDKKQEDEIEELREAIDSISRGTKVYDVCIVGGGAAGVACAYALKNSGLKTVIIESQSYLGGTHTQGYVSSLVPTPAPPFLKDLFYAQLDKGQACMSIGEHAPMSNSDAKVLPWKKTYYHNPTQYCCVFNPRALSLKYAEDLSPYVDMILGSRIVSAVANNGIVESVTMNTGVIIQANQFIDCTGNDILLSLIGATLYLGGDSSIRYQSEYGFTEDHGYSENYNWCNAVTLLYRAEKGTEDLSTITAGYYNNAAYWFYNADPAKVYFNTINYVSGADSGYSAVVGGFDVMYNSIKDEMIRQWKTIKNGFLTKDGGKLPHPVNDYKFDCVAPMLGIRESYRAKCERMLHEGDMYVAASVANIKIGDNLDKKVALGTYIADLFNDPHISAADASAISSQIKTYGVPYGSMIPKGFKNVLVASRGAGYTHIAASSFRPARNMMQMGWAAGYATILLNEDELDDYRNVDVEKLQSEKYADIVTMVYDATHIS